MIHKQTTRRKSLQHEGLLQSANHQTKLWIETALKKANIAVKHDTVNDFKNAIFYYSEAVDLLNKVLENSKELKEDMDGLEAICDIYLERIEFLSYLMHPDSEIMNEKNKRASSNKEKFTNNIDDTTTTDNLNTQNLSRLPKPEHFNSMFLNIFSKRKTNKKEGTHLFFSSSSKHKNQHPEGSKSTPTKTPEPLWKRQVISHHISTDRDIHSRRSSFTSSQSGSTDALCLPLKGSKSGHEKNRNCLPNVLYSKSFEKYEAPTLPRRNCNRNGPSSITCVYSEPVDSNPCLKIPKKSSQRKTTNSSDSFGKHISEPIRDSSLSHIHGWRARNSPSVSSSFSNMDIPNVLERKMDSVASFNDSVGKGASQLIKIPTCLDFSNMAINSSNESTIKIPILGTAKIDPFITMHYPEAMTSNNESHDRPHTPLRNGYLADKLYISKGFM
ncbi:hypothetical protein K501DRAFT_265640 [Backusella circina FSU 941]|nr:hypothetical protein K501DRAFT_265640 [Backusella circina FSU 941]